VGEAEFGSAQPTEPTSLASVGCTHPTGGKPALSTGSEAVSHTAVLVPRLAIKGELVLHGNLSCLRVYNGCHTSFDKLLLAEKRAAHDGRLRGTDVRVTYQYHVDGALSTWPGLYITIVPPVDGPPQWFLSPK